MPAELILGAAGLALTYGLLAMGAHYLSLRLLFPRPPLAYDWGPDIIRLTAEDGTVLAARHWANPEARHTLLYLHGNYEDLGSLDEYLPQYVQAGGYAVFAVDYRGYGHSGGHSTPATLGQDAELAYAYLREELHLPSEQIILFGYSLGGAPASELALRQPAAGLVLQGAFVSAYRTWTRLPVFLGDKMNNLKLAPQLRLPVLVIHGTDDRTVSFSHGQKLYAAITAPKMKLFVRGGPHTGLADFTGPRYWEELKRFTDSLWNPKRAGDQSATASGRPEPPA